MFAVLDHILASVLLSELDKMPEAEILFDVTVRHYFL
jgi:hypothetical protein